MRQLREFNSCSQERDPQGHVLPIADRALRETFLGGCLQHNSCWIVCAVSHSICQTIPPFIRPTAK